MDKRTQATPKSNSTWFFPEMFWPDEKQKVHGVQKFILGNRRNFFFKKRAKKEAKALKKGEKTTHKKRKQNDDFVVFEGSLFYFVCHMCEYKNSFRLLYREKHLLQIQTSGVFSKKEKYSEINQGMRFLIYFFEKMNINGRSIYLSSINLYALYGAWKKSTTKSKNIGSLETNEFSVFEFASRLARDFYWNTHCFYIALFPLV